MVIRTGGQESTGVSRSEVMPGGQAPVMLADVRTLWRLARSTATEEPIVDGVPMKLRTPVLIMMLCLAVVVASCGSVGDGDRALTATMGVAALPVDGAETAAPADTEAPTETETPPETEAPPSDDAPATDEGTGDGTEEDSDDGGVGGTLVLIAVAALLIAGLGYLLVRPRRPKTARPTGVGSPPVTDVADRVLGDIGWFEEQLSLGVLSAPPAEGLGRWRAERPRIDALARDCQRLKEATGDTIWGALAGAVSTLAQSLDAAVKARDGEGRAVDPTVTRELIEVVNQHRSRLSGLADQARQR